jgi:hypothetical protein
MYSDSNSYNSGVSLVSGLVILIIIVIVVLVLLCCCWWFFTSSDKNCHKKHYKCQLTTGSKWKGKGIVIGESILDPKNSPGHAFIELEFKNVDDGAVGVKYYWKRINEKGQSLASGSDEAFGILANDGSIHLTELRENASLKLTPLANGKMEYLYVEYLSSDDRKRVVRGVLSETK